VDQRLRRLQRQLCRQQKDSHNREKTRKKLARLHLSATNLRKDKRHPGDYYAARSAGKTKPVARRPRSVVLEDLNVGGMLQNRKLARAVSDVGLSAFRF
jgi:putative transposase